MPRFGDNKNVMCYIDDIYVYLRARADDAVPGGRPDEANPKPPAFGSQIVHGSKTTARSPDPSLLIVSWRFCALLHRDVAALARAGARTSNRLAELVDPDVFRACGDPRNLPFSNDKSEGFENKLAELFAAKLGKKLSYTYFPQATGFVRDDARLLPLRCDHGISARRRSGADRPIPIIARPTR